MIDYIIIMVVLVILGFASYYVYKAKKKGQKCIGCPYNKTCGRNCQCEK